MVRLNLVGRDLHFAVSQESTHTRFAPLNVETFSMILTGFGLKEKNVCCKHVYLLRTFDIQSVHRSHLRVTALGNDLGKEFERLLYSRVIAALKDVMGTSGLIATKYYLKLDEHTFDSRKFHSGLYDMFHVGSEAIEQVILQELFNELGVPLKQARVQLRPIRQACTKDLCEQP